MNQTWVTCLFPSKIKRGMYPQTEDQSHQQYAHDSYCETTVMLRKNRIHRVQHKIHKNQKILFHYKYYTITHFFIFQQIVNKLLQSL
jgi:hypothetical protein